MAVSRSAHHANAKRFPVRMCEFDGGNPAETRTMCSRLSRVCAHLSGDEYKIRPAAAVIPAPIAYIKVVAVKKLVVEVWSRTLGLLSCMYLTVRDFLLGERPPLGGPEPGLLL